MLFFRAPSQALNVRTAVSPEPVVAAAVRVQPRKPRQQRVRILGSRIHTVGRACVFGGQGRLVLIHTVTTQKMHACCIKRLVMCLKAQTVSKKDADGNLRPL